jgi:hypothetical protein
VCFYPEIIAVFQMAGETQSHLPPVVGRECTVFASTEELVILNSRTPAAGAGEWAVEEPQCIHPQ